MYWWSWEIRVLQILGCPSGDVKHSKDDEELLYNKLWINDLEH